MNRREAFGLLGIGAGLAALGKRVLATVAPRPNDGTLLLASREYHAGKPYTSSEPVAFSPPAWQGHIREGFYEAFGTWEDVLPKGCRIVYLPSGYISASFPLHDYPSCISTEPVDHNVSQEYEPNDLTVTAMEVIGLPTREVSGEELAHGDPARFRTIGEELAMEFRMTIREIVERQHYTHVRPWQDLCCVVGRSFDRDSHLPDVCFDMDASMRMWEVWATCVFGCDVLYDMPRPEIW